MFFHTSGAEYVHSEVSPHCIVEWFTFNSERCLVTHVAVVQLLGVKCRYSMLSMCSKKLYCCDYVQCM